MEIFKGVMLSSWNSVYGPKIEYMWLLNNSIRSLSKENYVDVKNSEGIKECYSFLNVKDDQVDMGGESKIGSCDFSVVSETVQSTLPMFKKYLRMCGKLLLTEMETKRPFSKNCSRIYHLEDKILHCVVFYKRNYSLEETKDHENVCFCLCVMLSCNDLSCALDVQSIIDLHVRRAVDSIQKSILPTVQSMAAEVSEYFEDLYKAISLLSLNSHNLVQTIPRFSQFQLRVKFLARAIVSHMETSGHSVIIGTSKFTVNQVVQVLLLFNNNDERLCSVPVTKNSQHPCYRGLHVQGLTRSSENQALTFPDDYLNDNPITIIDTDSYKVRQSLCENSEYNRNSLKTVTESGKLIPQFLQDLFLFEEHKWATKDLLINLHRLIHLKAAMLIKIVEKYRCNGYAATEKQLMTVMNVSDVTDFKVYLGFAEKMKPGIYTAIM